MNVSAALVFCVQGAVCTNLLVCGDGAAHAYEHRDGWAPGGEEELTS